MNNEDIINIGDWVYNDGYGVVVSVHPVFYDIYDYEIYMPEEEKAFDRKFGIRAGVELGYLKRVLIQIKRFCKYDGTPIRKDRMSYGAKDETEKLTSQDYKIIEKAKKDYPKEYGSFLKLNKDVYTRIWAEYSVNSIDIAKRMPEFFSEKIIPELPDRFISDDLYTVMQRHHCPFKLDQPLPLGGGDSAVGKINLVLFYRIGDFSGAKTMFSELQVLSTWKGKYDK